MKFKRLLTLTLSATMLFSSLTVSAATSKEAVLQGTDTAQSSETLVTGKQGSTFLVRIPKTMNITIKVCSFFIYPSIPTLTPDLNFIIK